MDYGLGLARSEPLLNPGEAVVDFDNFAREQLGIVIGLGAVFSDLAADFQQASAEIGAHVAHVLANSADLYEAQDQARDDGGDGQPMAK